MNTPIQEALMRLRNSSITLGKDANTSKLLVSVDINGKRVKFNMGAPGSVPQSVSRCFPDQNIGHCRIDITPDGMMNLANLKPQNVTYVNGMPIMQCGLLPNSIVQLGCNFFNLNVSDVLTQACSAVNKAIPPEFPINHLEGVWEAYRLNVKEVKNKQKNINDLRLVGMIFTPISALLIVLIPSLFENLDFNPNFISIPATCFSALILVYALVASRKFNASDSIDQASENLQDDYVCPNPVCRHFVGMQPYKILKQSKQCPYCKAKWRS